jgi:hypothetical protein
VLQAKRTSVKIFFFFSIRIFWAAARCAFSACTFACSSASLFFRTT